MKFLLLGDQDRGAGSLAAFKVLMRLDGIGKPVFLVDADLDDAFLDDIKQFARGRFQRFAASDVAEQRRPGCEQ